MPVWVTSLKAKMKLKILSKEDLETLKLCCIVGRHTKWCSYYGKLNEISAISKKEFAICFFSIVFWYNSNIHIDCIHQRAFVEAYLRTPLSPHFLTPLFSPSSSLYLRSFVSILSSFSHFSFISSFTISPSLLSTFFLFHNI